MTPIDPAILACPDAPTLNNYETYAKFAEALAEWHIRRNGFVDGYQLCAAEKQVEIDSLNASIRDLSELFGELQNNYDVASKSISELECKCQVFINGARLVAQAYLHHCPDACIDPSVLIAAKAAAARGHNEHSIQWMLDKDARIATLEQQRQQDREAEREACAKVCESRADPVQEFTALHRAAIAIRARAKEPNYD